MKAGDYCFRDYWSRKKDQIVNMMEKAAQPTPIGKPSSVTA